MATKQQQEGLAGSGENVGDRGKMLSAIVESLGRSRENESWGLMVEAAEDYQRWVVTILTTRCCGEARIAHLFKSVRNFTGTLATL